MTDDYSQDRSTTGLLRAGTLEDPKLLGIYGIRNNLLPNGKRGLSPISAVNK